MLPGYRHILSHTNSPSLLQTCRARIKLTSHSISFYNPKGESVDMMQFIDDVKNFDPDAIDDETSAACRR